MTHTHPSITHPYLRHRCAVALNQLRHTIGYHLWNIGRKHPLYNIRCDRRLVLREMAERMAALEQQLDTDQEARIFGQPARIS